MSILTVLLLTVIAVTLLKILDRLPEKTKSSDHYAGLSPFHPYIKERKDYEVGVDYEWHKQEEQVPSEPAAERCKVCDRRECTIESHRGGQRFTMDATYTAIDKNKKRPSMDPLKQSSYEAHFPPHRTPPTPPKPPK